MKKDERNRHLEPCECCGNPHKADATHVCESCLRAAKLHFRVKDQCPKCRGPLVRLNSQNCKICNDCKHEVDNPLKPGQVKTI